MRFNEGKNIRVSNEVHKAIVDHISEALKIGKWVENAIKEKIERESINGNNNPLVRRVTYIPNDGKDHPLVEGTIVIPKEYIDGYEAISSVPGREYENLKTK